MHAGRHPQERGNPPSCLDHVFYRRAKPDMGPSVWHPIRRQHLENVLRALGQDQPVQITALADNVSGSRCATHRALGCPRNHRETCRKPDAARRHAAASRSQRIWGTAGRFAGAPTWAAPLYSPVSCIFLCFSVAVVTCWAYLRAAHPRIVRVIAPLDPGDLAHSEVPCRSRVPMG